MDHLADLTAGAPSARTTAATRTPRQPAPARAAGRRHTPRQLREAAAPARRASRQTSEHQESNADRHRAREARGGRKENQSVGGERASAEQSRYIIGNTPGFSQRQTHTRPARHRLPGGVPSGEPANRNQSRMHATTATTQRHADGSVAQWAASTGRGEEDSGQSGWPDAPVNLRRSERGDERADRAPTRGAQHRQRPHPSRRRTAVSQGDCEPPRRSRNVCRRRTPERTVTQGLDRAGPRHRAGNTASLIGRTPSDRTDGRDRRRRAAPRRTPSGRPSPRNHRRSVHPATALLPENPRRQHDQGGADYR